MNKIIYKSEVIFSDSSVSDSLGRVFFKDNRVYRGINNGEEARINSLLESEIFKILIENGYIPKTKIADFILEDYSIVLEHEKIQTSTPAEWSFSQIKDAALFLLKLNKLLKEYNYHLLDGHLWNVSFNNGSPILLDIGSIIASTNVNYFDDEFINTCVIPLILYTMNESYLAKALLSNSKVIYQRTIPSLSIRQSNIINSCIRSFFTGINYFYKSYNVDKLLNKALDYSFIEKYIKNSQFENTMWGQYQDDFFETIDSNQVHKRFERFCNIGKLVNDYCADANSVIDLAGNQGSMLFYLDKIYPNKFDRLINIDYDEISIEKSIINLKKRCPKVHTYLVNFVLHKRENIVEFKCDIALALAITHHLILSQGFYIDVIFDRISKFSNKYVFIEFMPWGLWGGGDKPDVPNWYTEQWFEEHFKQQFDLIYKEDFGYNRYLFIGKIRT